MGLRPARGVGERNPLGKEGENLIRKVFDRFLSWQVGIGDFRDDAQHWQFVPVGEAKTPRFKLTRTIRWSGGWRWQGLLWLCFVDLIRGDRLYEPVIQVEYAGLDHGAWIELSFSGGYHGRLVVLLPTTIAGLAEIGPAEIRWQSYREGP